MRNGMLKRILILTALMPGLTAGVMVTAQGDSEERKQEVLQALEETADYVADVLINEEGYSRCDYNLTEGVWYD